MIQTALQYIDDGGDPSGAKLDQHLPDVKARSRAQADLIADIVRGR